MGKGCRKRAWQKTSRSRLWTKCAAESGFVAEIIVHWITEQEAFDHERKLIAEFKALGAPLVNMTEGGDGVPLIPELVKRRAATLNETNKRSDVIRRRKAAMKLVFDDPGFRARHIAGQRAVCKIPEVLARKQAAIKRVHNDAEIQTRRIASMRVTARSQEYRDRKRNLALKNGNRPPTYHGGDHPMAKKVICIETGELFLTVRAAVAWLKSSGLSKSCPTAIVAVCRGRQSSAYKYHWQYAEIAQ